MSEVFTLDASSIPWETFAVCALLVIAPALAAPQRQRAFLPLLLAALAIALFSASATVAYAAIAAAATLHAAAALRHTRTGAVMLGLSAVLAGGVVLAIRADASSFAFWLSCLTIALRAGVMPLHVGVASLCDRARVVQTQQMASTVALVFVHLRFVDHHAAAIAAGPAVVGIGAAAAVVAALVTLVQKELSGFYRGTTAMHGGMLLAAVGAASIGNFAAALLVAITMALALSGMGLLMSALEERVGTVRFDHPGGYSAAFPKLAAAFALFGGAGIAIPGTAGFVADDLLLHTLWMESPTSTVAMILASALLAIATLMAYSRAFLGRPTASIAPDLFLTERVVVVTLFMLLLFLGFVPGAVLEPADALLRTVPPA